MRTVLLSMSALIALSTSACAQELKTPVQTDTEVVKQTTEVQTAPLSEGQRLAQLAFKSVDTTGKGFLHTGDIEAYRENVFLSMDYDESNSIELSEFMGWDYGFQNAADEAGKRSEYDTAIKTVFTLWDRDGDGSISTAEHRYALRADFNRMDMNGDSILNEEEFLRGFSVMAAIRSALKED